eukprot:TRINITY_DN9402_c0_g3_i1.p1 TRINITY_DN9402_c0_g3~~TRINITY_DN9402_c0_g3_i1.p1  ORF type:complete len:289 (-),score=67.60 TRINITY_DN9402_c0_g3_i1:318-1184(-)
MIFSVDSEGRLTDWCGEAEQVTGFLKREVLGMAFLELVTYPFRGIVEELMVLARKGAQAPAVKMPFFTKAGDRVDVSLKASLCDKSGASTGGLALEGALVETSSSPSHKDAQSEEAKDAVGQPFKKSRHQADTMAAQAMLFAVDESGCVSDWNKQAEALTLFTREEVMGRRFLAFITRPFRDAVAKMIRQATKAEVAQPLDIPFYDKNGEKLDVVLKAYPSSNQVNIEGQLVETYVADDTPDLDVVSSFQESKNKTSIWTAETCDSFGPLSQLQASSLTLESLGSIAE